MYVDRAHILIMLCVVQLIAGCVTTQPMNEANRARVGVVAMSGSVQKPAELYYLGPTGAAGMMFGAIGALATYRSTENDAQTIANFVVAHDIKIESIVSQELTAALNESGKLRLTDSAEAASATITVNIRQYGFSVPNGFSHHLVPILFVQCAMVDRSGTTIWQAGDAIRPLGNPVQGISVSDLQNPELVEKEWRLGARKIAKTIVGQLPAAVAQ